MALIPQQPALTEKRLFMSDHQFLGNDNLYNYTNIYKSLVSGVWTRYSVTLYRGKSSSVLLQAWLVTKRDTCVTDSTFFLSLPVAILGYYTLYA